MKLDGLSHGERFIVDWQYHMAGGFKQALVEAMCRADDTNLAKLALAFPEETEAFILYSRKDGWWPDLQNKITN